MQDIILQPVFVYGLLAGLALMFVVSQLTMWEATFGPKPQAPLYLTPYPFGPSTLEKKHAELKTKCEQLEARITELQTPAPPQAEIVTYQQAADWLRMVNTVTWTMGSIYLAAAFVALNGALSETLVDTVWRHAIGVAVCVLSLIWFYVDNIYSDSAQKARAKLKALEDAWNIPKARFFNEQDAQQDNRRRMSGCLRLSMVVPLVLGFFVAFEPHLHLGMFE